MKRIALFVVTNLAIVLMLGIVTSALGVNHFLTAQGLDLGQLLGFAAVNRLRLTPRLMRAPSTGAEQRRRILDRLARNSTCEFALGLVVLAIVGILGTLAPASHHHVPSPGQRIGDHPHQANGCIVNMAEIEQGSRLHSRSASPLVAAFVSSDAARVAPVYPSHCNIITFVTL